MKSEIQIKSSSSTPKYKQLIQEYLRLIRTQKLKLGDKIPSLNEICKNHNMSRDTVLAAYRELKSRGIISSRHGKGYYITSTSVKSKLKVFVLFDLMNGYKEILFRSLVRNLGQEYHIDLFFHYYNLEVFKQLIHNNLTNYGYFVIMPHFNEDVSGVVKQIPADRLLVIDKDLPLADFDYNSVYQDFENDVLQNLEKAKKHLEKYERLKFITNEEFQFIPIGIRTGIKKFCRTNKMPLSIYEILEERMIKKGDVFVVMNDRDLITLIKICEKNSWKPGRDLGIISYDETPLKEVLANGITVISTDFIMMGKTASGIIKGQIRGKYNNPPIFIKRKSL